MGRAVRRRLGNNRRAEHGRARRAARPAGGMNPFTYDQLAARIVFGAGRVREVGDEVERLGGRRGMLSADRQARAPGSDITGQLGSRMALSWNEVDQHVPVDLAERARSAATEESIDCVVCVGGGSSTGLAKALALSHAVP